MANVDSCSVCAGIQGPEHVHVCGACGRDAGQTALVVGSDGEDKRFYCDKYCKEAGEADHDGTPLAGDSTAALVMAARAIRTALAEKGVDWRKV